MKKKPTYDLPRNVIIERADQIPVTKYDVILDKFLVRRKVTILAGPSQTGKGHIEVAVAARISRGGNHGSWPDPTPSKVGRVLFFTGNEDCPSDTVVPNLKAAGADVSRICFFKEMRQLGKIVDANFGPCDVDAIERAIQKEFGGGFDLLIIDPIFQAIEGDSTNQNAVARALNNLAAIAVRMDVAILVVTHVLKSARGRDPLGRIAGPLAYGTVARYAWVTAHNPHYPNEPYEYVLVNSKYSLNKPGGGWGFCIEDGYSVDEFGVNEGSVIRWVERFDGRASDILQRVERVSEKKCKEPERAAALLLTLLRNGPVAYPDILAIAVAVGISEAALQRAKKILAIDHTKKKGVKHGASMWFLPDKS